MAIVQDLERMRVDLKQFVRHSMPGYTSSLLKYADELDSAYKDIMISKVAGQSGLVAGGTLAVIGFGLSFFTFGSSLGLCIAGSVIGGAGGIVKGGAYIADFVKSKEASEKAEAQLEECNKVLKKILENCENVSIQLERFGDIDIRFPFWCSFWGKLILGSKKTLYNFGWKMVKKTISKAIILGHKNVHNASNVASAAVPVFRTLGKTAKGFHIVGGVVSIVLLPIDIGFLVSDSMELHKDEAHAESKKIREAVATLWNRCPNEQDIDKMINKIIQSIQRQV